MALELWILAKGTGRRPSELLADPRALAIDLAVMRGALCAKRFALQMAGKNDGLGTAIGLMVME